VAPFHWTRILPRGPSNSITHSARPTAGGGTRSKNVAGAIVCRTGAGPVSVIRLSLPYSSRRALAVRNTPCSRAVPQLPTTTPPGSASRPCACRLESQTYLWQSSPVLLAPAGHKTDLTSYRWPESCRLAGTSRLSVAVRDPGNWTTRERAKLPLNCNSLKYKMIHACSRGFRVLLEGRYLGILFTRIS